MTTSDQLTASDGQYVTIAVASYLTGVPGRTLRRWIARGHIPTIANSGGRLIDVDAVRRIAVASGHMDKPVVTSGHSMVTDGQDVAIDHLVANPRPDSDHDPAIGDLATLIERQQQTIMELSGRCGFYQSEIQHLRGENALLKERIALLEAPKPDPAKSVLTQIVNLSSAEQDGQDSDSQAASEEPKEQPKAERGSETGRPPPTNCQDPSSDGTLKRFWCWLRQSVRSGL